jgi:AcrR family transcriptional regulator
MRSDERRESILKAATEVFGARGYAGATTDAVAKAAGVSQPYVVRMFGTKEALFLAVLGRSIDRVLETFEEVVTTAPVSTTPEELHILLGRSYADLLTDRGLLLSIMQAFVLGGEPEIGPVARAGFMRVWRFMRTRAGYSADGAYAFLSGGMMLNTLVGLRVALDYDTDPDVREFIDVAVPTKADIVRRLASTP